MELDAGSNPDPDFVAIFEYYRIYFKVDLSEYESKRQKLVLPVVPLAVLRKLCSAAAELFMAEPMLLQLNCETVIIGDLHGHILDLFRMIGKLGIPPARNYLFLGDLVDRGEFSTETTVLILTLKVLWPKNVFVIRGNHEFREMARQCGFTVELRSLYRTQDAEDYIMNAFSWIPIGAMIGKKVLCVHGGIGPNVTRLYQLEDIERPLNDWNNVIVAELLWSDPAEFVAAFQPSTRGIGFFFGPPALKAFMEANDLSYVIRGHECVQNGIEVQLDKQMITVFGASNYCGMSPNKSGVLVVHPDGEKEACFFPPLAYLKRFTAIFMKSDSETAFQVRRFGIPKQNSCTSALPALNPRRYTTDESKPHEMHTGRPPRVPTGIKMNPMRRVFSLGPKKEPRLIAPRKMSK